MANIDTATGIHYGTVYLNSLASWAYDEFFYQGTNTTYERCLDDFSREFRAAYEGDEDDFDDAFGEALEAFNDSYEGEEESYRLEKDGLELELSYLGGAPLVWVLKSPRTARVRLCSPCCPNAGDLNSPDEDGVEAYTLPEDWFANE